MLVLDTASRDLSDGDVIKAILVIFVLLHVDIDGAPRHRLSDEPADVLHFQGGFTRVGELLIESILAGRVCGGDA